MTADTIDHPDTIVDDRTHLQECGICHAPEGESCDYAGCHVGRRWEIGITHPGGRFAAGDGHLVADGGPCRPTVESNELWDHTRPAEAHWSTHSYRIALLYRGACLGCGWHADTAHADDSNAAVEDAHDHALPGWRALPAVHRHPYDASRKTIQRWHDQIASLYRAVGIDDSWLPGSGAPLRTYRQANGTRSHWAQDLNGYDISAGEALTAAISRNDDPNAQLSLF